MPLKHSDLVELQGFLDPSPFAVLKKQVNDLKSLSREERISILKVSGLASLMAAQFNEDWYLSAYPDIKRAVEIRAFKSGLHHYRSVGYFEGRMPMEISVDEEFYCDAYPDVKRAIEKGLIAGAKLHFVTKGYQEGRIPAPDYSFASSEYRELVGIVKRRASETIIGAFDQTKSKATAQ